MAKNNRYQRKESGSSNVKSPFWLPRIEDRAMNAENETEDSDIVSDVSNTDSHSYAAFSSEPNINNYANIARQALTLVDDIVLKNYLSDLSEMEIVPPEITGVGENVILFKINKMVYEKNEYATDKFISAISAMTFTQSSVFLIVDGHISHTDFYVGIQCDDMKRTSRSIAETLKNSLSGQFPGIQLEDLSIIGKGAKVSSQDQLLYRFNQATCISSAVGIPAHKKGGREYTNENYIQGLEKLAIALRGKEYTAIILATNTSSKEIQGIRTAYEDVYTQLSSAATQQLSYQTNESLANAITRSTGYSDGETRTTSHTITEQKGESKSQTDGTSVSFSKSSGSCKENFWSKLGKISGPLMEVGGMLAIGTAVAGTGGLAAPAVLMGAGILAGGSSIVGKKSINKQEGETKGKNHSTTIGTTLTVGSSDGETKGVTHTETFTDSTGLTNTIGTSKNFTLTIRNKHIDEILKRIDTQLERISMAESTGLWSTGAYFLSYGNDNATAEIGASIFRSIMQGENSGIEASAVNVWRNKDAISSLTPYLQNFIHPAFKYIPPQSEYSGQETIKKIPVIGTSMLSSTELAMLMGLPRKSVPGLPVIEHVSFAKEVTRHDRCGCNASICIGCISDQGVDLSNNEVKLDCKSLAQHVFVTGSTGCGKSEAVYRIIESARDKDIKFLVIEPAKGEYKNVFGDANVFGTNPLVSRLLRINPFRFPEGIHVLEHVDRLTEIFNVCWPMYAAMPAVLKKAMLTTYKNCGWDLLSSKNKYSTALFPSFTDLLDELVEVIDKSAYSDEVKSNYRGALVTRIESMSNGINGELFSDYEVSDKILFDENTVIDLSRVGSQETKSLIMGIIIMRLNEYRMCSDIPTNSNLRHLTVLEEAHNILKRTTTEQTMESSNVTGKSVEMLTNAIAEMRTYGEGFIIVDQSPTSIDSAAIKNTNTKIIMRLPDGDDRCIVGRAAGLKDNQIGEIAKLPIGIAVVYQNDWFDPVLCHIARFQGKRIKSLRIAEPFIEEKSDETEVLKLLLKGRISAYIEPDINLIEKSFGLKRWPTFLKVTIYECLEQYKRDKKISLWNDDHFPRLSHIVTTILDAKETVEKLVVSAKNFRDLNDSLSEYIHSKANVPPCLDLSIRQALMCNYGEGDQAREAIYSAWFKEIKDRNNEFI